MKKTDKQTAKEHEPRPVYYCKKELLDKGWTEALIKRFLGAHDSEKPNPFYRSAAPMKLYLYDRVREIEKSKEFNEAKERSQIRSKRMTDVAEKRKDELLDYTADINVSVPRLELDELYRRACQSYNEYHAALAADRRKFEDYEPATLDSDINFLNRIATNYLRHHCTVYDDELDRMSGKVGIRESHDLLQKRINEEILRIYPTLVYVDNRPGVFKG